MDVRVAFGVGVETPARGRETDGGVVAAKTGTGHRLGLGAVVPVGQTGAVAGPVATLAAILEVVYATTVVARPAGAPRT